jgi:hypothetical protein
LVSEPMPVFLPVQSRPMPDCWAVTGAGCGSC